MNTRTRKERKSHTLNTKRHILTKRRFFFIVVFLIITSILPAWAVNTAYYSTLNNKSGTTLVSAITAISHDKYSGVQYGSGSCTSCVWSAYETTDVYPSSSPYAGMIWEIYAGCTSFEPRTHQGSSCSNVCDPKLLQSTCGYNREHSLPKSWFGISSSDLTTSYRGPGVDLHHIYPTDVVVNTKRSNNPYGVVGSPTYTSPNGSKYGTCTWPSGYTGTVFEPADEYKGDLARSYLYMVVTWNAYNTSTYSFTQDSQNYGQVTFNDNMTAAGHFGLTDFGLELLLTWHRNDPVSQKEIDRNNAVEAVQGNRNPFIDYPCLVEYIWGDKAGESFTLNDVEGSFESTFVVGSSDGCACSTDPAIQSPKGTINVGTTTVGSSLSQQVTLTGVNLTSGNLALSISGTNAAYFSVSPASVSKANAEAGYTITITYSPAALGSHTAVLNISGCGLSTAHTVALIGTCATTYTVTWMSNGAAYHSATAISGNSPEIPEAPDTCEGYTFAGWTTQSNYNTTSAPADLFTDTAPSISGNTTFYAVFTRTEQGGTTTTNDYKKITTLDELTDGNYVVAGYYSSNYFAMKNETQSTYYIATTSVTPDANDVISEPDNTLIWAVTISGTTATFYNEAASKYLYTYTSGTYRNIGLTTTNSGTGFTMSVSSGAWTLKGNATSYYVQYDGSYNDFTIKNSTGSNPIYLYKQQVTSGTTYYSTSTSCQCTVTAESSNETQGTTGVQSL